MTLSNVFAEKGASDLTIGEIKEAIRNDNFNIVNKLHYFGNTIEGTTQYFRYKKDQSLSLIRNIRINSNDEEMMSTFLTVSAADLHWSDLHRLFENSHLYLDKIVVNSEEDIPDGENPENYITKSEDFKLRTEALKNNQDIVSLHLYHRVGVLEKTVFKTLGLKNNITKYEAQHRGTMHSHQLLHLGKSLSVPTMNLAKKDPNSEDDLHLKQQIIESKKKVINFTTKFLGISAVHPNSDVTQWRPPLGSNYQEPQVNCLQQKLLNVDNLLLHYELLINRVMIHSCKFTCFKTGCNSCRFNFPFALHGYYFFTSEQDENLILQAVRTPEVAPTGASLIEDNLVFLRNHPNEVTHIPEILIIWGGNTETRPVVSYKQVLNYLLGYIMKNEKASREYRDMQKMMIAEAQDDMPPRKLFSKLLNKTIGQRDISKQECFHILHGNPLVEFTANRYFININLLKTRVLNMEGEEYSRSGVEDHSDIYWRREDDPNFIRLKNAYENDPTLLNPDDITLYEFACHYTKTWRLHNQNKIPHITPNFFTIPKKSVNLERYSLFLKSRLLEHKAGSTHNQIFGMSVDMLEEEMQSLLQSDACPNLVKEEFNESQSITTSNEDNDPELLVQPSNENRNRQFENWTEFQDDDQFNPDDVQEEEASTQDSDGDYSGIPIPPNNYDWNLPRLELGITEHQLHEIGNWMQSSKLTANIRYHTEDFDNVSQLNDEQFRAFAIIASHLQKIQNNEDPQQLLLNIHGSAGSGKTYWLKKVLSYAAFLLRPGAIKTCAPSGGAANLINGYTIHSLCKIPPSLHELPKLKGRALGDLQTSFQQTKIVAIDEKSMIGANLFKHVDQRLREATGKEDKIFGGLSVTLLGDWNQLPPVGDSSIYDDKSKRPEGNRLYSQFKDTVIFSKIVRQEGEEQKQFREELKRLSLGQFTLDDWKKWSTRNLETLPPDEKQEFLDNALLACARLKDMVANNKKKIFELNQPIAFINAKSEPAIAKLPSGDRNSGLASNIILCKGALVRLTSNEWVEAGLTNGAEGTVHSIIYALNSKPPDLPTAVICKFPKYIGPSYFDDVPNCVPILPITRTWSQNGKQCSRTMLPLILGYAISIHRLQGQTVPKMILDPGPTEFASGLMFTGASRVKSFTDLAFSPFPYYQRFSSIKYSAKKKKEEEKLKQYDEATKVSYEEIVSQLRNEFAA